MYQSIWIWHYCEGDAADHTEYHEWLRALNWQSKDIYILCKNTWWDCCCAVCWFFRTLQQPGTIWKGYQTRWIVCHIMCTRIGTVSRAVCYVLLLYTTTAACIFACRIRSSSIGVGWCITRPTLLPRSHTFSLNVCVLLRCSDIVRARATCACVLVHWAKHTSNMKFPFCMFAGTWTTLHIRSCWTRANI